MARTDNGSILTARPRGNFIETPFVRSLTERALTYIAAGYPVHFRGPSGSGKTTLAMHVAHCLGRPTVFLCGDDEFKTSDLVGGQLGYYKRRVVDNFIHTVMKTEEESSQQWVDNRLTVAVREGYCLVYDEYTRSRPEANNVLLSVLEERVLVMPGNRNGNNYLKVHPQFAAIFTSNPEDYVGVHKTQDALKDRMVTIEIEAFDMETEVAIIQSRSGIEADDALQIMKLMHAYRESGLAESPPTIRNAIMIAKVLAIHNAHAVSGDALFEQACLDILIADIGRQSGPDTVATHRRRILLDLIGSATVSKMRRKIA